MGHMFADELRRAGYAMEDKTIVDLLAGTNWGTYVADWMLTMLCAVFLGCWWHSLLHAPGAFGKEFQQLRLGKLSVRCPDDRDCDIGAQHVLRECAADGRIAMDCDFRAGDSRIVGGSSPQGEWARGRGWLTATYVFVDRSITMVFVVMLLAGWGVADNWRRPA